MGDWFNEWAGLYCEATGGGDKVRAVLLACRHEITVELGATVAELGEVTSRLVAGGRVPEYPSGVTNAIAVELRALRTDRLTTARSAAVLAPPAAAVCRWCRDTGFVTVPLRECVEVPRDGPPRLVAYPGYRTVQTGPVLCDRPGCEPGVRVRKGEEDVKRPRPTLTTYLGWFGGVNVVALLEEHERAVAARLRALPGGSDPGWGAVVARIRARVAAARGEGVGVRGAGSDSAGGPSRWGARSTAT